MSVGSVNIVRDGLVLCLDGENIKSYPGSGDNWYDLTSNYNNGVLTNGATFSPSGNSIQFDGVDDYGIIPYNSSFNLTQDFTISVWVKTSSYSNNYQGIFNLFDNTPIEYNGFGIVINDQYQKYAFLVIGSDNSSFQYIYMDNNFVLDQWYLITGVNSGGTSSLYVNDVKQLDTSTLSIFAPINNAKIGLFYENYYGTGPFGLFNGNVSQCLLYNKPLTPSEILQNYNSIKWRFMNESEVLPSIVTDQLYLNLDAGDILSYPGSGTTWYDLTVNSHNATLTNGAYYDPSDSGVMVFDGINDYANVGSLGSGFGIFTLDMWFNSSSVTNYKNIIDFNGFNTMLRIEQYTSPGYQANWVNIGSNTRARMAISFNASGDSFGFGGDGPGVITDNTWYNLVVTFDGNYCSIYINNQKLVNNYLVTGGFVGYINDMRIGDGYDYSSRRFQGKIPVVRIYKKALSDSEVLQNYNVQKSRYGL